MIQLLTPSSKVAFTWQIRIFGHDHEFKVHYSKYSGQRRFFFDSEPIHSVK